MSNDYKYKYIKYKLKYLSVSKKLKEISEKKEIKIENNIEKTITPEFQYVKPCSGGCYLLDW